MAVIASIAFAATATTTDTCLATAAVSDIPPTVVMAGTSFAAKASALIAAANAALGSFSLLRGM
jgi:hypothetical protein